jgi:hypothetical protein
MSVVIADASPLNYLVLIGEVDVLAQLYGQIHVPEEVVTELAAPGAPAEVADWIHSKPSWLLIETVAVSDADPSFGEAGRRGAGRHSSSPAVGQSALGNRRISWATGKRRSAHPDDRNSWCTPPRSNPRFSRLARSPGSSAAHKLSRVRRTRRGPIV